MRNRNIVTILTCISIFSSILINITCINVFAESNEQSDIDITFEANGGATEPLDPDDPSILLQPTGQGTGAPGPLSIDYIPALTLGNSLMISTFEQAFPITANRPFIQITDLRGTGGGWNVRVSISNFLAEDDSTLPGASLVFYDGSFISPNMTLPAPIAFNPVSAFAGGQPADLLNANSGSGKGTWLARWYDVPDAPENGRVEVVIPGGVAHVGTYRATVSWQLMDVV